MDDVKILALNYQPQEEKFNIGNLKNRNLKNGNLKIGNLKIGNLKIGNFQIGSEVILKWNGPSGPP